MKNLLFLLFAGLSYTGTFAQASETIHDEPLALAKPASKPYTLLKNPNANQVAYKNLPKAGAEVYSLPEHVGRLKPEEKGLSFSVGPNPASSQLRIHIKENKLKQRMEFQLYDIQGQQVLTHSLENDVNIVNLGELPSGLYVYRMVADGKTVRSEKLFVE